MKHLSVIAQKLAKLDGSRQQIAEQMIDNGYYEGGDSESLSKLLELRNVYVDLDDEDIIVCFETGTNDGYMKDFISVELFADMFEIIDWVG